MSHCTCEILGLPQLPRPAFSFPGAWFALGKQELHLIADPDLDPAKRRHHHFALLVDDSYAAKAELAAKGVPASKARHHAQTGRCSSSFTIQTGIGLRCITSLEIDDMRV